MATEDTPVKESSAIVKAAPQGGKPAVEVVKGKVVLSLAIPLRNGKYGDYPNNFTVWEDRTPDLFETARLLHEGQEVWVKWTEKPAERGYYRDVVALRAKGALEAPSPTAPVADESSEAIWESMGATKAPPAQPPARAPTMPATAPAHPAGGNDPQRASIEAQVAAKIASEILRDMLATVDGTPESKMPIVRTLLPELTMIARAAIHEASQG